MRVVLTRREGLDSRDGVAIFIVSLAQALVELNHDVKIVVGSLRSRAEYLRLLSPRLDLSVHALSNTPPTGFKSILAWLRGKRAIDSFRPDLVLHSEAMPIPMRGTIIQVVHDLQPRTGRLAPLWRSIRRFSFKRCDHVVATTTELRDELVRDLGMPPSKLSVIPKCIDRQAYQGLNLSRRERAILHAGTLPYKDPAASIRAFGVIDDPSVRLYITGDITASVQEAVRVLPGRLQHCVTLVGEADGATVRGLHNRVRIAAFPTLYAVPVASATVMEAIAAGTPIVGSSRLSRDVLVDGENGLVVDTNPVTMAAACKAVLDDDALWLRLSAGADRMVRKFDAFRVAEQYLNLARGRKRNRMTAADRRFETDCELTNEHNRHLDHAL